MTIYEVKKCEICGLTYTALPWLLWRMKGFCSDAHMLQREQIPERFLKWHKYDNVNIQQEVIECIK